MEPSFLKGSSGTSAPATAARPGNARSSASASPIATSGASRPSPAADGGYPLAGVSCPPDPDYNAYRQDLADVALAGRVIASHYAEPLRRRLGSAADFRCAATEDSDLICRLQPGDGFELLDDTGGWAWGYGGADRRVGYIRSDLLDR
jgi:hypothetical protein